MFRFTIAAVSIFLLSHAQIPKVSQVGMLKVIPDHDARYFGAVLDKDRLAPVAQFIPGPTRLADWARAL
jgi:hypothetical protein